MIEKTSAGASASRLAGVSVSALAALLALPLIATGSTEAVAKRQSLSCSFIARQCLKECGKQAAATFCARFCGESRGQCLATGTWDSFGRKFQNVIRK
ncbi:MAG: hypothetical protein NW205_10385 [Hyphomicrobiaceae bacterium]|nr:hypothetical protein [Hyphomicrobiaceae bacterium]